MGGNADVLAPASLSNLATRGFCDVEFVGDILSLTPPKEEKDLVGEVARGWPTPTLPGDMDRLIPLSAPPLANDEDPPPPRGIGPLPGLDGEAIPPRPLVGDKGVPVGGDEDETELAEPPPPMGVGDACGISSGRGMFLPRGTFACSALPDRDSAQSPESKYFRSADALLATGLAGSLPYSLNAFCSSGVSFEISTLFL